MELQKSSFLELQSINIQTDLQECHEKQPPSFHGPNDFNMIRFYEGTSQEKIKFVSQYSDLCTSNDNHFNMHQEIWLEIKRQRKVKKRPGIGFKN